MEKRKKSPVIPKPKCQVQGCTADAVYGFRELVDGNTMTTSGFRVGDHPNWCLDHDAKMRHEYETVAGRFVGPL